MSKIKVIKHDHHRNGVSGRSFNVVIFEKSGNTMLGVVFDNSPGCCAVFDLSLLANQVIEFRKNSWRGDQFEDVLRAIVEEA